MIVLHY